jgi:hypothetical protein
MKRIFLFILLFSTISIIQVVQGQSLVKRSSYNTAFLMPKGKWECGILQPFRYGLNSRIEVNTFAFLFPMLPNAGIKMSWGEKSGMQIASEHSLSVPSVFLNTFSRKGIGGLLSPEFDFPFILGLNNGIILSKPVMDSALLNFRFGLNLAIRTGDVDPLATIDLPLFYPRMAQYYEGISFRIASSLKGKICRKWFYEEGFQLFLLTRKENNFNFENTGNLMWAVGKSLRIKGGYILSYGQYPFGNHWQLWPTLDLVFGSRW